MRTRYFCDSQGQPVIKAEVYEKSDHGILQSGFDADALKICARLKAQGHDAYIVGGAVRDLLIGRQPKDFDIVTGAPPNRVKRLFRNSRIIGKRFRLVHVYFHGGKIHEVATFRAPESGDRHHVFGTLEEDVMRRDYSMNALYYDPDDETIIDFVNGVRDIRKKVVKSVLPLETSFSEDPVRMLRAVKYAAITRMSLAPALGRRIKKQAPLLAEASVSRLSEELNKILRSRNAEPIFRLVDRFQLLAPLLPKFDACFRKALSGAGRKDAFFRSLGEMDECPDSENLERGVQLRYFTQEVLAASGVFQGTDRERPVYSDVIQELKGLLSPLVQPNRDVEEAVRLMFAERGINVPRRRPRHPEVRAGEAERERAGADAANRPRRRRRRKPSGRSASAGENGSAGSRNPARENR